ncbi:MAG: putative NAD(P)H nitroreductase YodC [Promethearchaeota archaeon]|jgi:nitroreductase|nr:MAG: putative NAD(P)H nitroreductase YodC [Candidatus Lokiarchaeota archaeon]
MGFEKMIKPEELLKFIKDRRTIRCFKDEMIPEEEIEMILEAGQWAPSASNRQAWKFIVIKNKEMIEELSKIAIYGKFVREAPVAIAIVGEVHENPNWYIQDTTLASMNMMLEAWSLGIGTCWLGSMDREKAKQIIGIEKDNFLLTILPFGYLRRDEPKPPPRKDLDEITEYIK